MNKFEQLGLSESLLRAIIDLGFENPTEVQEKAIPLLLEKDTDMVALAQTGTGKTAAFGFPLIQKIDANNRNTQALILSPTRELCLQNTNEIKNYSKYEKGINVVAVYGGASITEQARDIKRGAQIIVATPGRMQDMINRGLVNISQINYCILDEADEMLNMGFYEDITAILSDTPENKSTWLFSATMPDVLQNIISTYMANNALKIEIDEKILINKNIEHKFLECKPDDKLAILIEFLKTQGKNRGIIFCKTKVNTQVLSKQLISKNYSCDALHGDLMQSEREKVMRAFKNTKLQILIATDMAARGIDIDDLSYVIHYHLPEQIENFTHRSGRTARAGKKGISLCLIEPKEIKRIIEIEKTLGISLKKIPW